MDLDNEELKYTRKANGADRDIDIGEYVRTKEGIIGIIERYEFDNSVIDLLNPYLVQLKGENGGTFYEEKPRHSKNIIELIEVGDVLEIYFPIKKITKKVFADEYFKDSLILDGIIRKRIILKTILTKEQYNKNCYRLEE